ncbi:site-specific integrase [Streptomyces sioyaensis]|uniref:site-specific integrase n=1 Tax=Streptomyces sioyaensis TaxID=67364 RepID=UPI0037B56B36
MISETSLDTSTLIDEQRTPLDSSSALAAQAPPSSKPDPAAELQLAEAEQRATEQSTKAEQLQAALDAVRQALNPDGGEGGQDPAQLAAHRAAAEHGARAETRAGEAPQGHRLGRARCRGMAADQLRTGDRPSPVMVWTPEQAGQFLDFLADTGERLYGLFHLITFRGLRRGEACGVRWNDRNRRVRSLTIATQLVQDGWNVVESAPKTDSGERTITLDEYTDEVLEAHRIKQDAERLEWGEAWQSTGRMFTRENGDFIPPGWLSDYFERLVEFAGLPPIRLHDLRHVAASLMLAASVDVKIASEKPGHSETRITREIYQSVMPKVATEAAEATAAIVPRGASRKPALATPRTRAGPLRDVRPT